MPTPITSNGCAPAWVKGEGAVYFVWTTLSITPWKDQDSALIFPLASQFKAL